VSCEDIVGVGGDTLGVFTSAAQLAAVAGLAWLCRISPVQPGAARQQPRGDRRATAANTVDASFTEVTEAPKSEVTTSPLSPTLALSPLPARAARCGTACRAHPSGPVLARRAARLRAEAEATTIRVNTKSAEGAKAALLSSEFP
jgi:hypothetical protein